jgi:predicted extracellular nuclease
MAPTVLNPGNIAIIGYITNGATDSFSFVLLVPIAAGTVIYFTDNGWTGTDFRGSTAADGDGNENLIRFTANADITAGTVIRSIDTSADFTWATSGRIGTTLAGSYHSLPLGQAGEQIAAFQSANLSNPLNLEFIGITQIDNTGAFEHADSATTGSLIPGLSQNDNTAILFNDSATYAAFNASTLASGTREQWLMAINNPENWTFGRLTALPTERIVINSGSSTISADLSSSSGAGSEAIQTLTVAIPNDDLAPNTRIRDIQSTSHISPLKGQAVVDVPGIVTALAARGFYLQDPEADSDDRTSEGIFVFTSSAPTVQIGDSVQVSGTVREFRPGGSNSNNLTTTEIMRPTINILSQGNALPAAIVLGNGGRTIPATAIENDVAGNIETSTTNIFDPNQDSIDFFESVEGMRVQINNPVATSPTNSFGEIVVLADNGENATGLTVRGGSLMSEGDFNPERIQIDDTLSGFIPSADVGAKLSPIVGVVDYDFSNYEVLPTTVPTVVQPSALQKEATSLKGGPNQLTVSTFNVENLEVADGVPKFNALADRIVANLQSPDILAIEEIQDNNGSIDDGTVDASQTYRPLIDAIAAAGGPAYEYRQVDPANNQDGGETGGNIRQGFLYNPSRVQFVDRPGDGTPANASALSIDGKPRLSVSPGRIDPGNTAFNTSRKPLIGEFVFNGQIVFAIANHFNSKGSDQPLYGPTQPPILTSEAQRNQQAEVVKSFVQDILAIDPNANVIVLGDLNDFEFSSPLHILKSAGLTPLAETLPENERYTYNFQGNAQTLDHILVSHNLLSNLDGYDVVHINSEFADQISDHDPSVARFRFNGAPADIALSAATINKNATLE